jgi:hypothetical protein
MNTMHGSLAGEVAGIKGLLGNAREHNGNQSFPFFRHIGIRSEARS